MQILSKQSKVSPTLPAEPERSKEGKVWEGPEERRQGTSPELEFCYLRTYLQSEAGKAAGKVAGLQQEIVPTFLCHKGLSSEGAGSLQRNIPGKISPSCLQQTQMGSGRAKSSAQTRSLWVINVPDHW